MKCPRCQTELPERAKFCLECGQAFTWGNQHPQSHSHPEAERKRVTALFSDLSGYTAITEKLDPEEVRQITGRIFDGIKALVGKYEGFIEKFAGDGVLILFGVPRAHEDDSLRAILAAQEIHRFVEELSPHYEALIGRSLTMHSGINTGLVVSAEVDPQKGTHNVTGDTINVASRLSDLSHPGEILVGQDTYRVVRNHFAFEALEPATVRGKSEPVQTYKVISRKAVAGGIGEMKVSSEMVGRDQELAKLELQVLKAVNGVGSVVNVFGEPGIGKSRLLAELKTREVIKRVRFLEGRSISIGKNLSFHPIIDLFKQWCEIQESDTQTEASEKLEMAIRNICRNEADEIFPFVATMMGMKLRGKSEERVRGIEGDALEKLIFKNVRELLIRSTERIPIVIVMEDLHWADTTSLELIESLFYLAQNYRVVYINVFRPGYWQSADRKIESVPKWLPEVDFAEISLNPLDKQMGELLINNILQVKGLRPSIRQQIIDRAGGNPFFIEEVVRSLIEEGAIVRINGAFEVTEKIDHVVIPSTINDVLTARIDRLEEQTRDLIKIASVIGRSFFDRILKDVAESIERVDDRLAYLKDAELIRDRIRMKELEYLFKHALAQEAAYESTLLQQRKQLHRKVAQSIERLFRERIHEFYGMLAHHYSVGEDAEKAEEYLTKAGEEALKSSASSEALNYYKGAMELYIKTYGDTIDSDRMAKYEENIAFALFYRGHHAEAIHYFGKVLSRLGVKDPKNKLSITIKMVIALIILIKDLYLPSLSRKNIPTDLDLHILKIILYRAQSLSSVDAKRFFLSALWAYKRVFKYDLASSQLIFDLASGASVTFSWSGISFSISRKILHHVEQNMRESNYRIFPSFYQVGTKIHNFLSGNWLVELDEKVINHDIQTGATLNAAHYLIWTGFFYLELGDFAATKKIVDWLKHISDEFNDEGTRVIYYHLNTLLLKKLRRLDESIKDADECIDISEQIGQRDRIISLLGSKAQMHLMKSNLSLAKESVDKSMGLISNEDIVSPYYYSSHLMGSFLYNIAKLEEATISNNSQIIAKYRREALSSGKTVVRNSRKVASERTRAFLQMGRYFWVTGRKRQALKWWDRSIKEGERLGARPDLSRTYFEVGKRLSEPQSKYKELVGIDAKGYLEKARILFEEMGLERDLDDLDRLTADHGL